MPRRPELSHQAVTAATPTDVWEWYADVDRWPRWDGGVSAVRLDGPFATGTRGQVTLPNGKKGRLRLLDVREGAGFTDVVRLPMLRVTTRHELTPALSGTEIRHTVILGGLLARFFPGLTAMPLGRALPASVAQLAKLAQTR